MGFQEKFYDNYFRNQSSRSGNDDIQSKVLADQRHYRREIIPLLPIDKSSRMLDIGCGYGSLLLQLKELGYANISGVDLSSDQVKTGRELGAPVEQADLNEHLLANPNAYDVIIGIDIIEHFDKTSLIALLENVQGALKDGGCVIFRTPNCDAPFGSTYCYGDFTHETFLNFFSAEQVFMTMGFQQIKILPSYIETPGILKNLIRKLIWPFVVTGARLVLFASGKSSRNVLLTPNLLIKANK